MAERRKTITGAQLDPGSADEDVARLGEIVEAIQEAAPQAEPEAPAIRANPAARHTEFDPKWREAFEGLLFLGHLEDTVEIPGHSFVVRTLRTGEKLEALQVCRPYEGSISYARAYRAAMAAAGLVLVDGSPVVVASRTVGAVRQKYDYLVNNWYDPVIEVLYERIDALEGQVVRIMEEMGVYNAKPGRAAAPPE